MITNKQGIIINVSSVAADTPIPRSSLYVGVKSFIKRFSESIAMEVKQYNIQVQALCPGLTKTNFFKKEKSEVFGEHLAWLTAEEVVDSSIKCLKKRKVICVPGFFYKLFLTFINISSRKWYYYVLVKRYQHKK